jgi:AraC-like DNA-binding protein
MKAFSPEELWLVHLDNAIYQNINNIQLSADFMADFMGMSRAHFYRKISALTDLTPYQYIQDKRYNYARQLLEQGEVKSVKAVALAVGIRKVRYFSIQFKERFGQLPSEFLY